MANKGSTITVNEDTSLDRLIAATVSKVLVVAPPWVVEGVGLAGAATFHGYWGDSILWAIGLLTPTGLLTALAWKFSHHRSPLRRLHVTATTAASGVWISFALFFGLFLGLSMRDFTI